MAKRKTFRDIIVPASAVFKRRQEIVSFSPKVDIGIGGGVPGGTWLILSGKPKCGKSSSALKLAANAQKLGREVYYIDAEGRLDAKLLSGNKDLDVEAMHLIQSTEEQIFHAEDLLQFGTEIVTDVPRALLILDSSSALCAQKEYVDPVSGQTRSLGPKLLGNFCRKLGTIVPIQDTIIVVIQHIIANTSGYGEPWLEDGGQKIKYQADIKLRCKQHEPWCYKDTQIGQHIHWDVIHSSLGPPGAKIVSSLRYGVGIDDIYERIELGRDCGLITGDGWYTLAFMDKPVKKNGLEQVRNFLLENPDEYVKLVEKTSL